MAETQDNKQWIVWALIAAGVALVLCIACGVVLTAVMLLGFFSVPTSVGPPPPAARGSSGDPTNPDPTYYVEIALQELGTLEGGNDRLREVIDQALADPSVIGTDDWTETALIGENWINNGHDILYGVNPPRGFTDAHQTVMEAAEQCYLLNGRVYGITEGELDEVSALIDQCDSYIDEARTAVDEANR